MHPVYGPIPWMPPRRFTPIQCAVLLTPSCTMDNRTGRRQDLRSGARGFIAVPVLLLPLGWCALYSADEFNCSSVAPSYISCVRLTPVLLLRGIALTVFHCGYVRTICVWFSVPSPSLIFCPFAEARLQLTSHVGRVW